MSQLCEWRRPTQITDFWFGDGFWPGQWVDGRLKIHFAIAWVLKMKAPIVQQFMTRLPLEIEQIDTVGNAKHLMDLFGIRHVPVMKGMHIEGIVSERDILNATIRSGANIDQMPIEKICEHDVLTVGPLTTVDEVAEKMLQRHVGSAVVVDGGYVVGIFTATDALKILTSQFGKSKSASG